MFGKHSAPKWVDFEAFKQNTISTQHSVFNDIGNLKLRNERMESKISSMCSTYSKSSLMTEMPKPKDLSGEVESLTSRCYTLEFPCRPSVTRNYIGSTQYLDYKIVFSTLCSYTC